VVIRMRLIAFLLASCIAAAPAGAQGWKEYSYPEYRFAVTFPADPRIETTTYQVAEGRTVPARLYSVRQGNVRLSMTVAELANTGLAESAVIDDAIRRLSEGGEVGINIPHRIDEVYGRQFSIVGADGSRSTVALFDYKGRFYRIEGTALTGASDAMVDAMRFQQSLIFTDGGSNRSPAQIRAIREGCRGVANPAGLDDPRCQLRR
jgi:hypothetical protein